MFKFFAGQNQLAKPWPILEPVRTCFVYDPHWRMSNRLASAQLHLLFHVSKFLYLSVKVQRAIAIIAQFKAKLARWLI
ncbi:hypothetical protein Plhal710r2_c003g0015501 [Plasmopara halstedii]